MPAAHHSPVYLNHAACGLAGKATLERIHTHLHLEAEWGGYVAAEKVADELQNVRQTAAALLNCHADEIALMDSGTRAWHRAIASVELSAGHEVLVSPMCWGGNYFTLLHMANTKGIVLKPMPSDANGQIDLNQLDDCIGPNTRLIELCIAGSGWAQWQQAQAIGQIARDRRVTLLIDASQALGQQPLDVQQLNCDLLVASGRKWLAGPRGTGILFASNAYTDNHHPNTFDQHGVNYKSGQINIPQGIRKFELGENSIALQLGLGVALQEAKTKLSTGLWQQAITHANTLVTELKQLNAIQLPNVAEQNSAIVVFKHKQFTAQHIKTALRAKGFEVNVHPASFMPTHLPTQAFGDSVRVSPSHTTGQAELRQFISELSAITE